MLIRTPAIKNGCNRDECSKKITSKKHRMRRTWHITAIIVKWSTVAGTRMKRKTQFWNWGNTCNRVTLSAPKILSCCTGHSYCRILRASFHGLFAIHIIFLLPKLLPGIPLPLSAQQYTEYQESLRHRHFSSHWNSIESQVAVALVFMMAAAYHYGANTFPILKEQLAQTNQNWQVYSEHRSDWKSCAVKFMHNIRPTPDARTARCKTPGNNMMVPYVCCCNMAAPLGKCKTLSYIEKPFFQQRWDEVVPFE